jgi:CXXC-20-CXXC protein
MAFNKKCFQCNHPLDYKTLLSQIAIVKCPACKTELQATLWSKVIFSFIFILPFVLILMVIDSGISKMVFTIVWIIINFFVIQPMILKY